ncbi:hypothetical protein [Aestuariibius sp. HNIBRBA575]|uniref:hypothetical protein n=1 Tax=Aestuariibius sp. HNIBRBA575 TaxID=3233343 RepID=UPI0034A3EA23
MKKIVLAVAFAGAASTAFAGGDTAPMVDVTPAEIIVAPAASSSSSNLIVPAILVALIAAAAAGGS